MEVLEEEDALYDLAMALNEISVQPLSQRLSFDYRAAEQAREFIHAVSERNISLDDLEKSIRRDRWSCHATFVYCFGNQPTSLFNHAQAGKS